MNTVQKTIDLLNRLLAVEFNTANQNFIYAEMCDTWGYKKIKDKLKKQWEDKITHFSWIIQRIIFLGGVPSIPDTENINASNMFTEIIEMVTDNEKENIKTYCETIKYATEIGDYGTSELLERILERKKHHLEWAESQNTEIHRFGLVNYLSNQGDMASCWF